MLVNKRTVLPLAALAAALLGGCATEVRVDPATVLAPGQVLPLQEADRLVQEAETALAENRLSEANALYVRVVTAYPNRAQAWFRLGTVYMRGGQYGYAQRAFQETLRADPNISKAQANLALAHLQQFRAAAVAAVASPQVPEANRKALASLVRDFDHALNPGAASAASAP
jgi:predicted Zn-dependent protease